MNLRVASYNTHGLRLGRLGDKAQRIVIDKLLENADIVCVQEALFLSKQDLDKLNSVNDYFYAVVESTTDLSMGTVHGRIPGGVAIL